MHSTNQKAVDGFLARGAGLLASVLLPAIAAAEPGEHIRAGEATITPSISIGSETRTNVYHAEDSATVGTNLMVAPGIEISTSSAAIDFSAHGNYELRKYFSDAALDRYNDFDIGADLSAGKTSPIGLRLSEGVGLRNFAAETSITQRPYQSQFRNQTTGAIVLRPGGALEFSVGGLFAYDDYKTPGSDGSFNRKSSYGPTLEAAWKFFPRTAVLVSGSYTFVDWANNTLTLEDGSTPLGSALGVADSQQLRLRAGLRGRVTERLVVEVLAGYGSGNYDETSVSTGEGGAFDLDVNGLQRLLVNVNGRYTFGEGDTLTVGYDKNFEDSFFTNFNAYNRIYGSIDAMFGPKFGAGARVDSRFEAYQGEVIRDDIYITGGVNAAYYFKDWASIGVNGGVTQRTSNNAEAEYTDFLVAAQASFVY